MPFALDPSALLILAAIAMAAGGLGYAIARGLAQAAQQRADALAREVEAERAERERLVTEVRAEALAERQRREDEHERRVRAETQVAQLEPLRAELAQAQTALAESKAETARQESAMAAERKAAAEKLALLDEAQSKLGQAFEALSKSALDHNNQSFLALAREQFAQIQKSTQADLDHRHKAIAQIVDPVSKSLEKMDGHLRELETKRSTAYGELSQQVKSLAASQQGLEGETRKLVQALRSSNVRGRWGEMQLQRVVELAGLQEHCDFDQQVSVQGDGDERLRPDMVVHLPGGKTIVVDAKASLDGYLSLLDAEDEGQRRVYLAKVANDIRARVAELSKKAYWDRFPNSPEFVVLFLPGEGLFATALHQDPSLFEYGVDANVVLASPTTLIGLLRAVAFGWRQEALAENAREITALGKELYGRLATMGENFAGLGRSLTSAVGHYNKTVGSLEGRVLPSARKFRDLKVTGKADKLPPPPTIEQTTRTLTASELTGPMLIADETDTTGPGGVGRATGRGN